MARLRPFVKRLAPFPGSKTGSYQQGSVALSGLWMRSINYQTKLSGQSASAQFTISIQNGMLQVDKVVFLSGSQELRGAEKALAKVVYPHSFPDKTPARILRKGTLTCTVYSKMCTLILMPAGEATGSFGRGPQDFPTFQINPN